MWESIRRPFLASSGEQNTDMTNAFAKVAASNLDKLDFKRDYHDQLPLLLVFLKSYPEYLESVLPVLYKVGHKQEKVRAFLDDVHAATPDVLTRMLPTLFKSEKALAMQIPLLMDMGRYLDKDVFGSLDFKLLLKATPEKLLKAFTPTPATWDAFMELAKGLVNNEATKDLAKNIACSVGLQVSMAKPKDEKSYGVNQYDWVDVAAFWKAHDWQWNVGDTLETVKLRAKGGSLVADMVYSMASPANSHPEKAQEAMEWVNAQGLPATPHEGNTLDAAVQYMYTQSDQAAIKQACLAWFNERAENCHIFQYAWRVMPAEDMVVVTKKLVSDVLVPLGVTKASILSRAVTNDQLPGQLAYCGAHLYTLVNHSALPLGNMEEAMGIILRKWSTDFPAFDPKHGHDYREHAMKNILDTIVHDLQEPARQALQESNGFKQLMLYAAYLKHVNDEQWSRYTFKFMPDLTDKPLSMLSAVYPQHQDAWARVQQKVLDGSFKREDTIQLIAKVLFNQDLTLNDILSTCTALDCKPETFFCSLQAPSAQAFIPDSFDFSEVVPT